MIITDQDIDAALKYKNDPLGWIERAFPWESGQLAKHKGPRAWQAEHASLISAHLQDPEKKNKMLRIAVASGHGIGKSAYIGMIINWALSTMPRSRVIVTANTGDQLATKTWPEILKWAQLSHTADWFVRAATRISSVDPEANSHWRADLATWSDQNTESFAGLHNEGNRIVVIMDEASPIIDKVWEVVLGAGTDEDTQIIWLAFGNPTRNVGMFRECFRQNRNLWKTMQIDSRTVEGTNKQYLDEIIDTYGVDSDVSKVRVRGLFPSASAKQFISTADVDAAFGLHLREDQYNFAPKILTCDPAWEGDDDLVIGLRQGLKFEILAVIEKNDNDWQVGTLLARFEDEKEADAVFIDAGYGTGIYSFGKENGRDWKLVWFASAASKPGIKNKRTEMWQDMRDWIKNGGSIPDDKHLYQDLIGPELMPNDKGELILEPKKHMKARGIPSPGRGDALALTFAYPVSPKMQHTRIHNNNRREHNPFSKRK